MGSLSEGQKPDKDTTSESDYGDAPDPVYDDEDDEEKIIEMRRKKREELLKKLAKTTVPKADDKQSGASFKPSPTDDDCIILETEKPTNGKDRPKKVAVAKEPPPVVKTVPAPAPIPQVNKPLPESTTPPLPPGHFNKFGPAVEETNSATTSKPKETKKNDWDMFAEQDCDSNFDVSSWELVFVNFN